MTFLSHPFHWAVQEHHQRKEDKHHRFYAAHARAVLIQLGGSDSREDGGVGGGETEDRQTGGCNVAQVSVQQPSLTNDRHLLWIFIVVTWFNKHTTTFGALRYAGWKLQLLNLRG